MMMPPARMSMWRRLGYLVQADKAWQDSWNFAGAYLWARGCWRYRLHVLLVFSSTDDGSPTLEAAPQDGRYPWRKVKTEFDRWEAVPAAWFERQAVSLDKAEGAMKQVDPTNAEFRELVEKHNLGRRDVARMIFYRIDPKTGQCHAVNNWLARPDSTMYRPMPERALEMLKFRLANLTDQDRAQLEGPADKVAIMAANRAKRKCFQRKLLTVVE